MLRSPGGRARPSTISVVSVLLALSGGMLAGCGDSSSDAEPKVTITSVEGDGNLPGEIETAIIVKATNLEPGDLVEFCDAATGVRKTGGVLGQTPDDPVNPTQITVDVEPSEFEAGKTKTIVSRKGVPKGIKEVTYLSGPTYVAGAGIDIDGAGTIATKLSATGGLENTQGVDSDELGLIPGDSDGQILKWNDTSSAWELGVDEGGAGSGTVDTVVAGSGIAVDAADAANPVVSIVDGMVDNDGQVLKWNDTTGMWEFADDLTGGAAGGTVDTIVPGPGIAVDDTDPANPEVSLVEGTSANDGQVLKWNDTTGAWEFADDTGGAGTDTLQDVVARGGDVLLAAAGADVVDVRNTDDSDGSAAIRGYATGGTAINYGLYGQSDSNAGYGVFADSANVGLHAQGAYKAAEFAGAVDVTGDVTVTGALTLTNDPPGAPMEAATKKYVDDSVAAAGGGDITGVAVTAPLTGGGPAGDVTIGIDAAGAALDGYLTSADWNTFNNKADAAHDHTHGGDVTGAVGATVVGGIHTRPIRNTDPNPGDVLKWDGNMWLAQADAGLTSESQTLHDVVTQGNTASIDVAGGGAVDVVNTNAAGYGVVASGNVGIYASGTGAIPQAAMFNGRVEVSAPSGSFPVDATYTSSTGAGHIRLTDTNGAGETVDVRMGTNNTNGAIGTYSGHDLDLWAGGNPRARITSAGNVGIGTLSPNAELEVSGRVWATSSEASSETLYAENTNSANYSRGIRGRCSSASGVTYGVRGESASSLGAGVSGEAPYEGVTGYASAANGETHGVYGESVSAGGYGVYARGSNVGLYATGGSGAAEFNGNVSVTGALTATSLSGNGSGLTNIGDADTVDNMHAADLVSVTGDTMSGMLTVATSDQYSVNVRNSNAAAAATWGVYANADGANAGGTRFGVQGLASGGGTNYGVYGTAPAASGYGVYANGRLHATGAISTGSTALVENLNADTVDGTHGDALKTKFTRVNYSAIWGTFPVPVAWTRLGDIGSFDKDYDAVTSAIEVIWTDNITLISPGGNRWVQLQARIDDISPVDGTLVMFMDNPGTFHETFTFYGYFTSLGAGPHTVSLWIDGTNSDVQYLLNPGGFPKRVIVKEVPYR